MQNDTLSIDIGIDKTERHEIAQGLAKLLADSYTLYLKTHNFHWNVTGPFFQTLHTMFEEQYVELAEAVDVIAERIRALGIFAPASYKRFSELTSINDQDEVPSWKSMVQELVAGHETVVRTARSVIPKAAEVHDEASADLLTQRIQLHEKTAWMLRSLLDD